MRLVLLFAAAAGVRGAAPEQVFITTTGTAGEMAVSWVTIGSAAGSETVEYGPSKSLGSSTTATSSVFTDGGKVDAMRIHVATLTGLKDATQYFYTVAGDATVRSFTAAPQRDGGNVYGVVADFGYVNDVAMDALLSDAAAGGMDALIHAGDFAYNLQDTKGKVGNDFMNAISPAISTIPYYTSPGNHEADTNTFSNYLARFAAVNSLGNASGSNTNLFYSFNDGPVHFVGIDTEMWSYGATAQEIAAQKAWLEADLAAVDRSATPWVVGFGHKAYWMDHTNWTAYFDDLFAEYNVDLYFCGHTHNYQRTAPAARKKPSDPSCVSGSTYTGCKGTTFIVAGSPGCKEKLSTGTAPSDVLLVHEQAYGYGKLTANETHLAWYWGETVAEDAATGELVRVAAPRTDSALFVRA